MASSYDLPETREAMQQTFKLIRLQISSPLSLLITIGVNLVASLVFKPSLADIARNHPSLMSPNPTMLSLYWLVLYCFSILLVLQMILFSRSPETRDLFVKGVGMRFSLANYLMVGWVVFYEWAGSAPDYGIGWAWWTAFGMLVANALNLITIYITMHKWTPASGFHRRVDWVTIHIALRMFLVVVFCSDWLETGFLALNWGWVPRDERNYAKRTTETILGLVIVHLIGNIVVFFMKDGVWAVAAMYLLLSLLFNNRPTPTSLIITIILLTASYPVTYICAYVFHRVKNPREALAVARGQDPAEAQRLIDERDTEAGEAEDYGATADEEDRAQIEAVRAKAAAK